MAIGLLFDAHVDHAIASQLRLKQVDVRTAQEEGIDRLSDEQVLEYASRLGRPIVTHDIRFHALAGLWLGQGRPFCGLIFAHLLQMPIGRCVHDLEIVAKATDPEDWANTILRLPL